LGTHRHRKIDGRSAAGNIRESGGVYRNTVADVSATSAQESGTRQNRVDNQGYRRIVLSQFENRLRRATQDVAARYQPPTALTRGFALIYERLAKAHLLALYVENQVARGIDPQVAGAIENQ